MKLPKDYVIEYDENISLEFTKQRPEISNWHLNKNKRFLFFGYEKKKIGIGAIFYLNFQILKR